MTEHEKWLSRRVYHETFSKPGTTFPGWRGVPNRCKCGCDEVWYDRLSPTNWWTSFNLAHYASVVWRLVVAFVALQRLLWNLPPVIWIGFRIVRAGYKREVLARIPPGANTSVAIIAARLLVYGIIAPLVVIVWATMWTLARPGAIIIIALFVVTLGLTLTVLLIPPNSISYRHFNERPCVHHWWGWVHFILRQSCHRHHGHRAWGMRAI